MCDNFSPHKHPEVRAWCTANQVELVFLPTYASWLNWIEAEFAAVRYFALNGTDHHTHTEQDTAIGAYIRWRNHRAHPKAGFATGSKIRHRITRSRPHDEALANGGCRNKGALSNRAARLLLLEVTPLNVGASF
ncbi:transposase [Micromonospora sp. WMMD714]|uniref:transposase n=1 Tax=Micromonospora sp. WMMD714 TaxID=3016097 RepID=UPI00249AB4D7|nr:transposase [Micromonospora sp. WMMD714]WFE67423.1 transposase [Micromonospora sp. WMMD714]